VSSGKNARSNGNLPTSTMCGGYEAFHKAQVEDYTILAHLGIIARAMTIEKPFHLSQVTLRRKKVEEGVEYIKNISHTEQLSGTLNGIDVGTFHTNDVKLNAFMAYRHVKNLLFKEALSYGYSKMLLIPMDAKTMQYEN
jgi:hypothetical protein